jgi:hypothetical protein
LTAQITTQSNEAINLNHLRQGGTYIATTRSGLVTSGEYLGVEVSYDQWRILLRGATRTASIAISDLESVYSQAA